MDLPPIQIRSVYAANLEAEFKNIDNTVADHPFIAINTVYPGAPNCIYFKPYELLTPDQRYENLKVNVNRLPIIQLGLTLSDAAGNLPVIDGNRVVWEFNFSDFDPNVHNYDPDFLDLKRGTHPNLYAYHKIGIPSKSFQERLIPSMVILKSSIKWLTFHGAYHLGYLLKIILGRELPPTLANFKTVVHIGYLGKLVFDLKHVAREFNIDGGLERISEQLGVERTAEQGHPAGTNSLLTSDVFHEMKGLGMDIHDVERFCNVIYGLDG